MGLMHRSLQKLMPALTLISLLTFLGCNPWYIVESSYHPTSESRELGRPKIVRTDEYNNLPKRKIIVALRAPDSCANLSSAQITGEASGVGDLIKTDCGVEMAGLERALVSKGYRVMSWNEVNARVRQNTDITPIRAAKDLNAEILFQVNSLEKSLVGDGLGSAWRRTYYASDLFGNKISTAHVPLERSVVLDAAMRKLEEPNTPPARLAVTVDVTAISTRTGESIWFYRETRMVTPAVGKADIPTEITQLFECNRRHIGHCVMHSSTPESGTTGSTALTQPTEQRDAFFRSRYFALVQETMVALATEFTDGQR